MDSGNIIFFIKSKEITRTLTGVGDKTYQTVLIIKLKFFVEKCPTFIHAHESTFGNMESINTVKARTNYSNRGEKRGHL